MTDRDWLVRALIAIVRHPSLYGTAIGEARRLAVPGWWRRRPFLPLPAPDYQRFRIVTMYGGDGSARIDPDDLIDFLRWCRERSRRR